MRMKKNKKYRKKFKNKKKRLQEKINQYTNKLNNPKNILSPTKINLHSWVDANITYEEDLFDDLNLITDKIKHDGFRTKKIKLLLNKNQEKVIIMWMRAYTIMYNDVTNYFRTSYFNGIKPLLSIKQLKSCFKNVKKKVIEDTKVSIIQGNIHKTIKTSSHLLDYAINDSLTRYNSCLTNLREHNIHHFRLRYLKINRPNRIIKIEKLAFRNTGFYVRALGDDVKCEIKDFNYLENINTTAILQYQSKTRQFYLLLKYKSPNLSNKEPFSTKANIISIDAGIRPMFNGYANDHILKIGEKSSYVIRKKLQKIDRINRFGKMSKGRKQRIINKKYTKIKDMIMDLQWKVVKYLTENYSQVVIGNFSTKTMGETKMNKMTKRIGNMFSLYKFKQKLKYKSLITNTKFVEIDEAYTSKCCSCCGNYKKNLGSNKVYKCTNCKIILDRDINGAKNILINAIRS